MTPNDRGQRPEGEQREPPVRCTARFGRSCSISAPYRCAQPILRAGTNVRTPAETALGSTDGNDGYPPDRVRGQPILRARFRIEWEDYQGDKLKMVDRLTASFDR